jgi:predicted site-specific integrase-resolvase
VSTSFERPLSERDAADYIGISIHTLRKWRKAGKGPTHFAVSRVIRYAVSDLQAFVAANQNTAIRGGQQ